MKFVWNSSVRLMRLNQPMGIWLLFFPCVWGLALADDALHMDKIILFFFGSLIMRSLGCIWNDFLDKNLDRQVERTKNRPLASSSISMGNVLAISGILGCLGFAILLQFNTYSIILGMLSLPFVILYPLMKRLTHWAQLFLGLTFSWGALMGCAGIHGDMCWQAWWLYIGCISWVVGYDTVYAYQDFKDDQRVGIKSTAVLLKNQGKVFVMACYAIFFLVLGAIEIKMGFHWGYQIFLLFLCLKTFHKIHFLPFFQPHECSKFFRYNKWLGVGIWAGFLIKNFIPC